MDISRRLGGNVGNRCGIFVIKCDNFPSIRPLQQRPQQGIIEAMARLVAFVLANNAVAQQEPETERM